MTNFIKTWSGDIHPIPNKTIEEIHEALTNEWVKLPSGGQIRTKSVEGVLTASEVSFQGVVKSKGRIGQYMKNGKWHDQNSMIEPVKFPGPVSTKFIGGGVDPGIINQ